MPKRIVIVGAGIGGLCAARAVAIAGHDPVVLERAAGSSPVGAGLVLWPNAVRALDALGYGSAVRAAAEPVERMAVRNARGRTLAKTEVGRLAHRAGAPMLVIDRPALHEVLVDGLAVRYGTEVAGVDEAGILLEDGARLDADAVIGADGVNSVVRNHVCPGERAIDTGYTVIRGISDHELEAGYAFETWGRGELAGGVALPGGRSYWFYEAATKSIDRASPLRALGAGSWPAPTGEQVAQTPPGTVLVHRILRLRPLAAWTRGTVALLGDAAHAMEPNLGQGAAQTVEDAEAMLAALKTGADLPRALAAYAAERRRRAEFLQRESTRAARTALSTLSGPRDVFARLVPEIVQRAMLERLLRRHASPRSLSPGSSRERTRCPG